MHEAVDVLRIANVLSSVPAAPLEPATLSVSELEPHSPDGLDGLVVGGTVVVLCPVELVL